MCQFKIGSWNIVGSDYLNTMRPVLAFPLFVSCSNLVEMEQDQLFPVMDSSSVLSSATKVCLSILLTALLYNLFILYFLVLEKIIHRLIFYSKMMPARNEPLCMSTVPGGGNCRSADCKNCFSQRIIRQIYELTEGREFGVRDASVLLYQWERLFTDPSVLPSCFRLQGNGGFLHQLGKSFALLHQMDCIHMDPHAEHSSTSYRLEKIADQVLGN